MKTFFTDLIPKIQGYSKKLDDIALLTDQNWVLIHDRSDTKYVYIFRANNDLIISMNGKVEKGKWNYLGHDSLLIERSNESYLFRHGFFDGTVLALKVDGRDEFAFFINENKLGKIITSLHGVLELLNVKYKLRDPAIIAEELNYDQTIETISPLFGPDYDNYKIKFSDGKGGLIQYSHKTKRYYIEFEGGRIVYYKTKNEALTDLRYNLDLRSF